MIDSLILKFKENLMVILLTIQPPEMPFTKGCFVSKFVDIVHRVRINNLIAR